MLNQTITLGDYVVTLEDSSPLKLALTQLDRSLQVQPHPALTLHPELIANQIIRYKDSQKVNPSFFEGPLFIYHQDQVLLIASSKDHYLKAKGAFLVYTEAQGLLENKHNSSLVIHADHPDFKSIVDQFFSSEKSAGYLQRRVDKDVYTSFEELLRLAQDEGTSLMNTVYDRMTEDTKEAIIHQTILHWYLLKKLLYVQTMMNTKLLQSDCQGDMRILRNRAKHHADLIPFIMYSELWRHQKSA